MSVITEDKLYDSVTVLELGTYPIVLSEYARSCNRHIFEIFNAGTAFNLIQIECKVHANSPYARTGKLWFTSSYGGLFIRINTPVYEFGASFSQLPAVGNSSIVRVSSWKEDTI